MKLAIATLLAGSAAAFTPSFMNKGSKTVAKAFTAETIPGALAPVGFWDPLGFAEKAGETGLKKYREAELTHGRVAMLATIGFLVGEAVESKTVLFNGDITGPAITQLAQVNPFLWVILGAGIAKAEITRAEIGWLPPSESKFDQPGLLREEYIPGNLEFDPLGLKPEDPEEFVLMQTKELQNGRLAMLAAAGFIAQELVDGKGIFEHLGFQGWGTESIF